MLVHSSIPISVKMSLAPMDKYTSFLFKHPHQLQVCTINLTNMESIICKTINSRPKNMVELLDNSIVVVI